MISAVYADEMDMSMAWSGVMSGYKYPAMHEVPQRALRACMT